MKSAAWLKLAQRHERKPLTYVHGWRVVTKRGVCCDFHSHRDIEVVYHAEGHGVTRTDHVPSLPFREGSIVIYPPNEKHDQIMDKPGEDLCFLIQLPHEKSAAPREPLYVPRVANNPVIEDIRTLSRGPHRASSLEQSTFDFRATSTLLSLIHMASLASDHEQAAPGGLRF